MRAGEHAIRRSGASHGPKEIGPASPETLFTAQLVLADSPPLPSAGAPSRCSTKGTRQRSPTLTTTRSSSSIPIFSKVTSTIALRAGDEPGRSVEDAAGRIHVALRRGGDIVTIDPTAGSIVGRRTACANPRGLAYDAKADAVHVACVGGELVTFPAAGGTPPASCTSSTICAT